TKKYCIYKVYNVGTGDEVFINFKPTQKDLYELAVKQSWDVNEETGELYSEVGWDKIEIFTK
ncbi:MAG: hypothetical protein AABY22_08180, partial [Nanoarchaeota archaeon]